MGRPVVGLLYNSAVPDVIEAAGSLVEHLEVIPDRFWYDFGTAGADDGSPRFQRVEEPLDVLRACAKGRVVVGHGIGMSLPSAMPIDGALLDQVCALAHELEFAWFSEHLSMFLTPSASVPNAQAGLGLPVTYDHEQLDVLAPKVACVADALALDVLMENGTIFTPVPDVDMTEPEFFAALTASSGCGVLLDLHNLYANVVNNGLDGAAYLAALDPASVKEIHVAGGDRIHDFYMDSHSGATPEPVWEWAEAFAPRFPNLRAITYEFHESYYSRLGNDGIIAELERAHALADQVG